MAFVPNIDRLRSNFAMRGDFLRNDFSSRYGGGGFGAGFPGAGISSAAFAGAAQAASMFRSDAGDMVKKVVKTDTKTINDQISSTLNERIQEEIQKEEPSYTRPNERVASQEMTPDQIQEFISRIQMGEQREDVISRTMNTRLDEDASMKNVAAALQTTENEALNQIQIPIPINFTPTTPAPQPTPPPPPKPVVSQQFTNMVGDIFGKKDDAPEGYKMSKMDVTYTKVAAPEDEMEDIDSVDVTGRVVDQKRGTTQVKPSPTEQMAMNFNADDPWERFKMLYLDFYGAGPGSALTREPRQGAAPEPVMDEEEFEDIESVDVTGKVRTEPEEYEDIESIDVVGKVSERPTVIEPQPEMRPAVEPQPEIREYVQPQPAVSEFITPSDMMRDARDILSARDEREQMTDMTNLIDLMRTQVQIEPQPPVVINNNRTVTATPMSMPRTERIFSDDNTFNRLSLADSSHPSYMFEP